MTTAMQVAAVLLMQLAESAVRAVILASAAGIVLAALRVKSTSARLYTWSAVLYAALAMPLLGWMLPPLSISMPAVFPSATVQTSQAPSPELVTQSPATAVERSSSKFSTGTNRRSPSSVNTNVHSHSVAPLPLPTGPAAPGEADWSAISWSTLAAGIYLAVSLLLGIRFLVAFVLTQRLVRASRKINAPNLTRLLTSRAYACGLSFIPQVAESECISVPVTMGVLRPAILLPTAWREWDAAKLDAVVAHELSHVARRDALTQRIALLHRTVFWFSPLAWWLDRHLATLAEQASDEAALSCGADRNHYARTLLGFFETLHAAPGRVWWQGVSMAKAGQAEQRVERILAWKGTVTMKAGRSLAVLIAAFAIPVIYLAASVRPVKANPSAQTQTSPATNAPVAAAPPAPQVVLTVPSPAKAPKAGTSMLVPPAPGPIKGVIAGRALVGPVAPLAPYAMVPPAMPALAGRRSIRSFGRGFSDDFGDEQRFVIVSANSDDFTMSGSGSDARHAIKLKKQISGDFIWFERDDKYYVIRDPATVDRAKKLWAPQQELGDKQEELGRQQEELGKQQEALGQKMEKVQVKVPDISAELDRLKAKLQKLGPSATMEQIGDLQSEIGELQSKIGDIESQAGEQQSKLGDLMGELGEKQGKLGEQQGKLGELQEKLSEEATRQMKLLFDEAITKGTAQPEPQTGGGSL